MTPPAGVRIRRAGEPRPTKYRRKPEPQGPYAEECADAAAEVAAEWKRIAQRVRAR